MNLRLLQLGDSALPIGSFSHSWGLEAAQARGDVRNAEDLERWVRLWLRHSIAPFEGVIVAAVSRAAEDCVVATATAANELLHITLTPPTLRHASAEMGDQLLRLAAFWDWAVDSVQRLAGDAARSQEAIPWHHAAVFAVLARAAGASPREALSVYLHQGAVGVLSAGVRAIPIGHTHGQQALSRLHDEIEALADEFVAAPLESAGAGAPAYEITCHEQSGLYSRLFRS